MTLRNRRQNHVSSPAAWGRGGILTDADSVAGEQEETRALFADTYAVSRNPSGHRDVDYDDVVEAAEMVQTASLLMRISITLNIGLLQVISNLVHAALLNQTQKCPPANGHWSGSIGSASQSVAFRPHLDSVRVATQRAHAGFSLPPTTRISGSQLGGQTMPRSGSGSRATAELSEGVS